FFASAAQLVIITYGGYQVMQHQITVGDLVFFLSGLNMLLQPIRMAGMFVTMIQRAGVGTRRLHEIFDAIPSVRDEPSHDTPDVIRGEFDVRHLNFTYPRTEAPTLHDINIHIAAGESIGIVGRVGCGKSTFLKQFTRMVNTNRGQLFLDGYDVCDYPIAQLRTQIAQVLQDPFLFGEPLRSNISYDDPERHLEVIWDSAEAAALRDTILEFPAQMETVVGERGVTLSGGQKQRTTLARGLIRNAPVLILDDCFSSVDTETEEHILRRLDSMRQGKTTILVSHRVSTLRHCDRIVVMDEGRIVELGSHEELLRLDGIYAALERIQTQGGDPRQALEDLEFSPV
ncbi:MAG TPA: ABC transporter ATP-binding protein, partial [Pseudomonadales bacterium]|nr:ABC transporter ATP-binding protein [Pseudomonadales bacterium]